MTFFDYESKQTLIDIKSVYLARQKILVADFSGQHSLDNAARWNNQLRLPYLGSQKNRPDLKSTNLYEYPVPARVCVCD